MEAIINAIESLSPESKRLLTVWKALAPPIRPSPSEIESYARCWTGGAGARVLVQGITSELVDLAIRQRTSRVIGMDWRVAMFPAMRCLGKEDWSQVENIVCDWRTFLPQLEGALDLVLGDGSLTMIAFPEDWERVLQILQRYLVPGGRAVLRLAFQLEEDFHFGSYLEKTLADFDRECAKATPDQRAGLLRGLIARNPPCYRAWICWPNRRRGSGRCADLTRLSCTELTARYSHWTEWETVQFALPSEEDARKGDQDRQGRPSVGGDPAADRGVRVSCSARGVVREASGAGRNAVIRRRTGVADRKWQTLYGRQRLDLIPRR